MKASYHIERDFETIPMNFLWMKYHQIRFVSFGVWFLGLFLTDFTSIVNTPHDGWSDVIQYIRVISILHLTFLVLFYCYLLFRHFTVDSSDAPSWRMILFSMFDLSIHLDITAIIFSVYFLSTPNAMYAIEVGFVVDSILTLIITPYKRWRAMVDIFGALPTVILGHIYLYHSINFLIVFAPLYIVLILPLLFTVFSLSFSDTISKFSMKIIRIFDPTLLPNAMFIPNLNNLSRQSLIDNPSSAQSRTEPPLINDHATSGSEADYYDFKSFPAFILATFLIHFALFCQGAHHNTMVVMGHYFIALAAILVNTRVVAFPAIILTNVTDPSVQFNSVWPELSFV